MAELPATAISPKEFFEGWLPKTFGEITLPPGSEEIDTKLGVKLSGDGGGEWVFHLNRGNLEVHAGPRDEAAFTLVQSVDDWRGCLWEGRGGVFGQGAAALLQPGSSPGAGAAGSPGPSPAALKQMEALSGVIRLVVSGGTGGDWSVDFKLGPGAIPEEATTTLTISEADSEAMAKGELDPMQAFMAGRIQVAGDMALMMQVQAIQMQAQMQAQPGSGSTS